MYRYQKKLNMKVIKVACALNPSTWGSEKQEDSLRPAGLQIEAQDSQVYTVRLCLKNKTKQLPKTRNKITKLLALNTSL